MGVKEYGAQVRRADGALVGWMDSTGTTYDPSGESVLGHHEHGTIYLGYSHRKLGYVVPGGEIHRVDYKDANSPGLGLSEYEDPFSTRFWAEPVGRVSSDGRVTDMSGRLVGTVGTGSRPYSEDAMGTAALILLLRYA